MSRKQILYCCVPGCINATVNNPDLSFFSVPRDNRRGEWLRLISREDLIDAAPSTKRSKVCETHFSENNIMFTYTRKVLKKLAKPSLNLPSNVNPEFQNRTTNEVGIPTSSKSTIQLTSRLTQTDKDWEYEIEVLKVTAATVPVADCHTSQTEYRSRFYDLCNKYLTKDLASLIKANDSLKYKYITSNKDEYSQFCFNLYRTSPQAAQFFQSIYELPSNDMLLKQYVQIGTKMNEAVMLTLKSRVDKMSAKERNCSVLIGSAKLKANLCYNIKEDKIYGFQEINGVQSTEPAIIALVVMIQGIFFKWKQPIGYILIPQNYDENLIQNWMSTVIKCLFEIGLNVRTLVSSTKDDWINAIVCGKPVSIDVPYFFVDDKKIYHIFDAPDLVKSARDCMLLYDIHFQNKVAKYEDIVNFYIADQNKSMPYAQKLTYSHIHPNDKEKQEVKYAIQLMSKTVANGLWTYIHFNLINNANEGTVDFINNINDLFDILNISRKKHCATEGERDFCENKPHQDAFKEILLFFQNLKVLNPMNAQDVTSSAKFIKCILITVKSISLLFEDIKTEGHDMLLTSNLQLKSLENYINKITSCIKSKPAKPTTLQFTVAFRKCFFSSLKIFIHGGSTKSEVTNFLAQIYHLEEEMIRNDITIKDLDLMAAQPIESSIKISNPRSATDNDTKIAKEEYNIFDNPEKHSLLYICGYLLMMSKNIHKTCQILKFYLMSHVYEPKFKIDSKFRRYNQHIQNEKCNLPAVPCDSFIQFVEEMDEKFVSAFLKKHFCEGIVDSLMKDFQEIRFTQPCPCFPKKYVVNLFIRIKIFYMIRVNNKLSKKNRQHRKYLVPRLS